MQGQFKVVFVPDGGGAPIEVDPAQPGVDQAIMANYQSQINQIKQNSQQIIYGLITQIAAQQQQIAALASQMPGMNPMMMQGLMCPVIQPQPVYLDALMGMSAPLPTQNQAMGWGGMQQQGAMPIPFQPQFAPFPAGMPMFPAPAMQPGFVE